MAKILREREHQPRLVLRFQEIERLEEWFNPNIGLFEVGFDLGGLRHVCQL